MPSSVKTRYLFLILSRKQLVSFLIDEKPIKTQIANGERIIMVIPGKVHERIKLNKTEIRHTFQAFIEYRNQEKWYYVQLTSKDSKVYTGQASG